MDVATTTPFMVTRFSMTPGGECPFLCRFCHD